MATPTWYIRNRGQVSGPFNTSELESLRAQGKFARFHEVSEDRQTWVSASSLTAIFPAPAVESPKVESPPNASSTGSPVPSGSSAPAYHPGSLGPIDDGEIWYFSHRGSPPCAVSFLELKRKAMNRQIDQETLVWKDGLPKWIPCAMLPGIVLTPSASGPAHVGGSPPPPKRTYAPLPPHESASTSGFAVASLVLGLLYLCGLGSLLAILFGVLGLNQIGSSNGRLTGRGIALAGITLGLIGVVIQIIIMCFPEISPTY